jgi:hypothetical protein
MDNLTTRLKFLLRFFVFTYEADQDPAEVEAQFRDSVLMLVDEYGPEAVNTALGKLPDRSGPTSFVH